MKKLIVILSFILIAIVAIGQQAPAPELLFHKTEPNPTFINIPNIGEFAKSGGWLFAYSDNKVFGSNEVLLPVSVIAAFGQDRWEQGFKYGNEIKLGLYSSGKFYELEGLSTNWLTGNETTLKWYPLGLYKFEVTAVGDEIGLIADSELSEVEITTEAPEKWKSDDGALYLKVNGKNTTDPMVMTNGNGELTAGRWWIKDFGWATHQYKPSDDDKTVFFNAVAQNAFTSEMIQQQSAVEIVQQATVEKPGEPGGNSIVYADEFFKIEVETKGTLELWFIENLTNENILVSSKVTRGGKESTYNKWIKPNERQSYLMPSTFESIELQFVRVDNTNITINQKIK